jgi:hypothetical protein
VFIQIKKGKLAGWGIETDAEGMGGGDLYQPALNVFLLLNISKFFR